MGRISHRHGFWQKTSKHLETDFLLKRKSEAMASDLMELAQQFALPEQVLSVLREKSVSNIGILVKTFEDDEQFSDFIAEAVQKKTGSASRKWG